MAKLKNRTICSDQPREDLPELERFVENALNEERRWKAEFRGLWKYNPSDQRFVPDQDGTRLLRTRLGQYEVCVTYMSYLISVPNHQHLEFYSANVQKEGVTVVHAHDCGPSDDIVSEKLSKLKDLYQRVEAACKPLKWVPG